MPNIYTRTGDKGDTGLFGGSRVPKQSLRVEVYGTVDEANAALGAAKATLPPGPWRLRVHQVQQRLFVLAAELASDARGATMLADRIGAEDITALEHLIDDCLAVTGPQREFVVPGRDERSGAFHHARTVVRRAERRVLELASSEPVRPEVVTYLNRLSDAVYAVARIAETWRDQRVEQVVREAVQRVLGSQASGRCFDLAEAKRVAERAEARASQLGVPVVIAAVDSSGGLVLLHRMEQALPASTDLAADKAWSAAAFRMTTARLGVLAADGGALPGLGDTSGGRVVLFGGGVPVFTDGRCVGALGVSGGTVEQDVEIAAFALEGWSTKR
ncbi:MAG: cob(I)yrinic acid a,c-diamide adenosyltransferase [Propionibacteriaceae bacterium]|nr:cob(I)yrinic acid a,c-diamide adenosyltransferase [Propionibacteriaceae bacterium]